MSHVEMMNEIGLALAGAAHRLVSLSWQGSLFILAVALVTVAWRRGPACFKYGLWCLVLVKLLLPVSFSLPSGAVNVIPDLPVGPALSPAIAFEIADPRFEWPLMSWLGLAWAAGVVAMLFLLFARYRTVRMWLLRSSSPASPELIALATDLSVRMGLRRSVPIWTTHAITGPLVIGPLNPMIFIPEDLFDRLERDERAMLLAHELAHVKRRDTFVAAVEMIALAIHWFNPLAWMMMAAVRTQRELACDDRVVALFNDRAEEYGSGLLKIARFQQGLKGSAFGMAALGEGGSTIGVRVRNILSRRRPIAFLSIPALVALALVACVMLPNHARKQNAESEATIASDELIIENFDLKPVGAEKIDEKVAQDFANRVVEAIKTFLYSEKGIEAAKKENRELWFDPQRLQLTISDTRANMEQVRKYIKSLPELNADRASVTIPGLVIDKVVCDSIDKNDQRLLLKGNVKMLTPGHSYSADSIEYSYSDKTLTLRGNATVTTKPTSGNKSSVFTSDTIRIEGSDSKAPFRIRAEGGYLRHIEVDESNPDTTSTLIPSKTEPIEKDYQAAVALQNAGDLDAAEKAFRKFIDENKLSPQGWAGLERLAEIKRAQGDLNDSLKKYKTILDIYPDYPDIQRVREAIKQIEAGEKEPALKRVSINQVKMKMDKQEKKPNGDIEGSGNVYIEIPNYRVSGDMMYYEAATKKLIVSRNVTMRHRGSDGVWESTGYEFSIDLTNLKSGLMKVFPGTVVRQVDDLTSNTIER